MRLFLGAPHTHLPHLPFPNPRRPRLTTSSTTPVAFSLPLPVFLNSGGLRREGDRGRQAGQAMGMAGDDFRVLAVVEAARSGRAGAPMALVGGGRGKGKKEVTVGGGQISGASVVVRVDPVSAAIDDAVSDGFGINGEADKGGGGVRGGRRPCGWPNARTAMRYRVHFYRAAIESSLTTPHP